MKDNLDSIDQKFKIEVDDKRYAAGWAYKCVACGKEPFSIEGFFPCQDKFIPLKIWCDCGNRWKFELTLTDDEKLKLSASLKS